MTLMQYALCFMTFANFGLLAGMRDAPLGVIVALTIGMSAGAASFIGTLLV